jgi:hypothetical protein
VAGVVGVATFGTLYLALEPSGAARAFAVTSAAFGLAALVSALAAYHARRYLSSGSGLRTATLNRAASTPVEVPD